MHKNLTMF